MSTLHDAEIRQNFHFFQSVVADLMATHSGQYALLHDRCVVDVFARPEEALEAGHARYNDGPFSVQRVIDRPLDLGFMSYGSGDRTAD